MARWTQTLFVAAAFLWACSSTAAERLQLRSSVDGKPATVDWKYVKRGQTVTIEVVDQAPRSVRPPARMKEIRWFKLTPTAAALDNTTPTFHFEQIPYQELELEACRDRTRCPADVSNPKLPSPIAGTGTMAFKAEVRFDDGTKASTPGIEQRVSGGIGPLAHRVTVRLDDSYLGYLTELFGTPYIFGSAGEGRRNQTDLLIGSDCADLAIYGKRRMGQQLAYVSSYSIDTVAPEVVKASAKGDQGVLTLADGKPIRFGAAKGEVRPGDVLHFPSSRHVAVLYEDREPKGVLDVSDHILHTCWSPPTIQPIAQTNCSSLPVRVLRFK